MEKNNAKIYLNKCKHYIDLMCLIICKKIDWKQLHEAGKVHCRFVWLTGKTLYSRAISSNSVTEFITVVENVFILFECLYTCKCNIRSRIRFSCCWKYLWQSVQQITPTIYQYQYIYIYKFIYIDNLFLDSIESNKFHFYFTVISFRLF